ncbi:hypothetical protein EV589_4398 [Mycobacterium sp. BK558]|nr:hypothetical protein EV589_4398 [Mycobacterium sp. BK558]
MLKAGNLVLLSVPTINRPHERGLHDPGGALPAPVSDILTAEQVAKVLASVSTIGVARTALQQVGLNATIAGNRITVDHQVEAQFITANGETWWQVYTPDGTPPVWIVGAQMDPADWVGCVE